MEKILNKIKPKALLKDVHNVLGLGSAVFLIILLVTGILLNHPISWISGADAERFSIKADPGDSHIVYRGTFSSFERSLDGGQSWEEVPMAYPPMEVVDIDFSPDNSKEIYILQKWHGPLFSNDGGIVWEPVPLDFDPQTLGIELIALTVSAQGDLYLESSAGLLKRDSITKKWNSIDFNLKKKNWVRIVKTLHNGHFFGEWFVKIYDIVAIVLLLLIVTGFILWRVRSL